MGSGSFIENGVWFIQRRRAHRHARKWGQVHLIAAELPARTQPQVNPAKGRRPSEAPILA